MITGTKLQGMIHLNFWDVMEAYDLTIKVEGHEITNYTDKTGVQREGHKKVIDATFPVVYFPEYKCYAGQNSFPFEIDVPTWLPVSTRLTEWHGQSNMSVQYYLIAQLTPVFSKDFVGDPRDFMSVMRSMRPCCVFHQTIQPPPK